VRGAQTVEQGTRGHQLLRCGYAVQTNRQTCDGRASP
jgi:hypothetical protein